MTALDTQIGGGHYKSMAIQPMEFSMANGLDACQHTILKYVVRFRDKGGIQDLEKARHVIDMLIELETKRHAPAEATAREPEVAMPEGGGFSPDSQDQKGKVVVLGPEECGCPACQIARLFEDVKRASGNA